MLRLEIERIDKLICEDLKNFQMYSQSNGHDWRDWDKDTLSLLSDSIVKNCMTITCYISDFMVIIHNELLTPYYGYSRPTRKTIDPELLVLTKEGLISNIETDPEMRAKAEVIIEQSKQI